MPPPKANAPVNTFDPEKLAAIRGLAKVLPIAAPLAQYRIGSPFGPRLDPFNGKDAFHTGIDMDAPYNSPVYATAPGTVIYAGYLGEYGKTVEIDHGFGIDTLYAHLHRYFVAVGSGGRGAGRDRPRWHHRAQHRTARALRGAGQRPAARPREIHRALPADPGRGRGAKSAAQSSGSWISRK